MDGIAVASTALAMRRAVKNETQNYITHFTGIEIFCLASL